MFNCTYGYPLLPPVPYQIPYTEQVFITYRIWAPDFLMPWTTTASLSAPHSSTPHSTSHRDRQKPSGLVKQSCLPWLCLPPPFAFPPLKPIRPPTLHPQDRGKYSLLFYCMILLVNSDYRIVTTSAFGWLVIDRRDTRGSIFGYGILIFFPFLDTPNFPHLDRQLFKIVGSHPTFARPTQKNTGL